MFRRIPQFVTRLLLPMVRWYWRIFAPSSTGARALVFCDHQLLLIKTAYGARWQTPGGALNKNETPEQAVLRELEEETGIAGTIREKLGVYTSSAEGKRDTIHLYIVDAQQKGVVLEWELKAADWFPLDALPDDTSPATRRRINEYISGQRSIIGNW